MTKLLLIETSPRGEASVSRKLSARFISEWEAAHADGEIVTRDLAKDALPHVTIDWLGAYFTPQQALTDDQKAQLALSDELVQELLDADEIVISTPVYNYNIPAALKAWVDHIVRKGLTLGLDGSGLVTGKKATLIVASGGSYGPGSPIADRNIAPQYIRLILNVIGITDVSLIHGEAAKNVDMGETTMEAFVDSYAPQMKQLANA
ncbi:FMN-dependent NADH-azoreductase [Qingshengfaniella alkalisoli]|uniref:FMN dependent NADH:quinone oxidoreductase n=1 Tax=Qingshengfaniella alkalisoli TaxID=2599296 RepID=A0A5B8IZ36_9RHOB|nr:NAD(P)H-dependent oxidoreductase [Qingshengfaniella alkalisoli]QDY71392.1 FMN-dependent NADH-azoreductase [Qingshengfaniella alkalisoli]